MDSFVYYRILKFVLTFLNHARFFSTCLDLNQLITSIIEKEKIKPRLQIRSLLLDFSNNLKVVLRKLLSLFRLAPFYLRPVFDFFESNNYFKKRKKKKKNQNLKFWQIN